MWKENREFSTYYDKFWSEVTAEDVIEKLTVVLMEVKQ